MRKLLWESRKGYPNKTILIGTETIWMLHWRNFSFNWRFRLKGDPSKLHANIQLGIIGFRKCNGSAEVRFLTLSIIYMW